MNYTSPTGVFSALAHWVMETCGLCEDRKIERQRLASLAAKQHHSTGSGETGPHPVMMPDSAVHSELSDGDKDNYLRGQFLHGNRDLLARNNRETVTQWLNGNECLSCKAVSPDDQSHELSGPCGHVDYKSNQTRLADSQEISVGLDLECLSCFMHGTEEDLLGKPEPKSNNATKKTILDMPAMKLDFKRVELLFADATNRQVGSLES